jgi:hypothetical protein
MMAEARSTCSGAPTVLRGSMAGVGSINLAKYSPSADHADSLSAPVAAIEPPFRHDVKCVCKTALVYRSAHRMHIPPTLLNVAAQTTIARWYRGCIERVCTSRPPIRFHRLPCQRTLTAMPTALRTSVSIGGPMRL